MKTTQSHRWLPLVASLGCLSAGGCSFLTPPPLDPLPPKTVMKTIVFDPAEGITKGSPMNDPTATGGDAKLPTYFRLVQVISGNTLSIQGVKVINAGPPAQELPGVPEIVHLSGIFAPQAGQAGFDQSNNALLGWTLNQKLDVEQDPQYPRDFDGKAIVEIYVDGRPGTPYAQYTRSSNPPHPLNVNRMMVRDGFAVVDLYSQTSLDPKPWLNDEQYARSQRIGLWASGIILQGRQAPTLPGLQNVVTSGAAAPAPMASGKGRKTTTKTKITTSVTTNAPGTTPSAAPSGAAGAPSRTAVPSGSLPPPATSGSPAASASGSPSGSASSGPSRM